MPIEDEYLTIRRRIRRLGYRESLYVVWAYAQYLQLDDFQFPNDVEVGAQYRNAEFPQGLIAEWTLEQLVREIIRHAGEEAQRGQSIRQWATLAEVIHGLSQLEESIYAQLVPPEKIHLELMRISHRQFVWQQQKPNWRWIIRYYKLFNTPQIIPLCQQATGLTVDELFLIGIGYLGMFFENPRCREQLNIQVPGVTQDRIERFLDLVSRSLEELSNMLRAEHALDERFGYRYSSLREFPLVRIRHGGQREIACPIPTLLFWRITTGLYYALRNTAGFPTAFGQSFQAYVGEVLAARITNEQMRVLEEAEYRIGNRRKDTVDWIVRDGDDAALFLECKTKRLTWASKAGLSDLAALDQDIRKLAGAVVQVYRTIRDYRDGRYPNLAFVPMRQIYPAVVTLEDWYFFGHELPDRLDAAVRESLTGTDLPLEWLDEMPYSIMSVDEVEKVSGVVNAVGIRPLIDGKLRDCERRSWAYDSYCRDRYPAEVANLARLFDDEYEAMFAGIKANH